MGNLKSRIRGGESAILEFKSTCPEPFKLARVIMSLANSSGGEVCIGVDDLGVVVGLENPAAERATVEAALDLLEPIPETRMEALVHELKDVLVLTVEPFEFPGFGHAIRDEERIAYFRVGRETRPVSREVEKLVVKLRRHARGDRSVTAAGQRLIDWLWDKGESAESVCARRLNYSSRRLRKEAESLVGGGYLIPCRVGEGRTYVAIKKPAKKGR